MIIVEKQNAAYKRSDSDIYNKDTILIINMLTKLKICFSGDLKHFKLLKKVLLFQVSMY